MKKIDKKYIFQEAYRILEIRQKRIIKKMLIWDCDKIKFMPILPKIKKELAITMFPQILKEVWQEYKKDNGYYDARNERLEKYYKQDPYKGFIYLACEERKKRTKRKIKLSQIRSLWKNLILVRSNIRGHLHFEPYEIDVDLQHSFRDPDGMIRYFMSEGKSWMAGQIKKYARAFRNFIMA